MTLLRMKLPGLCGQTATESPHDRQDYGCTAALTKCLCPRGGAGGSDRADGGDNAL